ncbi:uncharacterized protein LOC112052520 [Bicyclus anynana]|uniref:Uncharacterized protein LOC112052520 n=1 Tax=Bicyclus anynana TaxID=110368 RepID=A0ABM3M3F3_BICAN|nr:uncharacterized protein LOC112052520 [Bicyclus anynana]
MLTVLYNGNVIQCPRLVASVSAGSSYENTLQYTCAACSVVHVLCHGQDVLGGAVIAIPQTKMISFNFPSFEDTQSCAYVGVFEKDKKTYKKILAVIEMVTVNQVELLPPPKEGQPFQHEATFSCDSCGVEEVTVNGIPLETSLRRNTIGSIAFYTATASSVTVRFTEYSPTYEGVYQAKFVGDGETATKTIFEIGYGDKQQSVTTAAPQTTQAQETKTEETKTEETKTEETKTEETKTEETKTEDTKTEEAQVETTTITASM